MRKLTRAERCQTLMFVFVVDVLLTDAAWNLFMNKTETKRLLGIYEDVYYVQNGTVNNYALTFNLPLKGHIKDIYFDWNAVDKQEPFYRLWLSTSNPSAIEAPLLSISNSGRIPLRTSTFSVRLPCSGLVTAEVDIRIQFDIMTSLTSNTTTVELRRRKTCVIGESQLLAEDFREALIESSTPATTSTPSHSSIILIIIGSTVGVMLGIGLVVFLCCSINKKPRPIGYHLSHADCARITTKNKNNNASFSASCTRSLLSAGSPLRPVSPFSAHDPHVMTGSNISSTGSQASLRRLIMEGSVGRLYYGMLLNDSGELLHPVLIKTVKGELSDDEVQALMADVHSLKGCNHANIRPMLVCLAEPLQQPLFIYHFTNDCNLKIYLRTCRSSQVLSVAQLVQMTFNVCSGICYLQSRQLLHRDIATRNCLVDDCLTVRLSDSALASDFFPEDYQDNGCQQRPVPVRWLPIETLTSGIYEPSSEVWAFGVTAWEMMNFGQQPYSEIRSSDLIDHLLDDHRLHQPANCPDELYELMIKCWCSAPETRPNFLQIYTCVEQLYVKLGQFV